jgi:hypothetical protein
MLSLRQHDVGAGRPVHAVTHFTQPGDRRHIDRLVVVTE